MRSTRDATDLQTRQRSPGQDAKLLLGAAATLILLLWAAGSVVSRTAGGFDSALSTFAIDHRSAWLTVVMTAATDLGSAIAATVLAATAIVILVRAGAASSAVAAAVALGGELVIEYTAKLLVGRTRPLDQHLVVAGSPSFPSGHAMYAAAFFGVLIVVVLRQTPRPGWATPAAALLVALTLLVGLSRIYLGVHWPSDVLAGWMFGAAWAAIIAHVLIPQPGQPPSDRSDDRPAHTLR